MGAPTFRRAWRRGHAADQAHPDVLCGALSLDEQWALASLERAVATGDLAFALRLSGARACRLRAWMVSRGGTVAGASLLATGTVGSLMSAWFVIVLGAGAVPALAEVAETRHRNRPRREPVAR